MKAMLTKGRNDGALVYSLLFLGIAIYSALFGYYTCISHYKFETKAL